MKLTTLSISNFQCFGPNPTHIALDGLTYLLGPNGAGKTAALHALARMFAVDPVLRGVRVSDFHALPTVDPDLSAADLPNEPAEVVDQGGAASGDVTPAVEEAQTPPPPQETTFSNPNPEPAHRWIEA